MIQAIKIKKWVIFFSLFLLVLSSCHNNGENKEGPFEDSTHSAKGGGDSSKIMPTSDSTRMNRNDSSRTDSIK